MSDATGQPVLISIAEIAQVAGVGRAAVGNWRKRHEDFPEPAVVAPSGALFDLDQIERWLVENDKITGRISPSHRLWALADAARGAWQLEETLTFLLAALVYHEACTRPATQALIPIECTWGQVRSAHGTRFVTALRRAYTEIEARVSELEGLLTAGLEHVDDSDGDLAFRLLDVLGAWHDDDSLRFELYEEAVSRLARGDSTWGEYSTPDELSYLIAQLAAVRGGVVLDPAVGEGGLLLMTLLTAIERSGPLEVFGIERVARIARIAQARFFLYDLEEADTHITVGNALTTAPRDLPASDVIVLDPPFGLRDWADAETYLDDRWRFGSPSPGSADMAWVQLAALTLKPEGRAYVLLPSGALSRARDEGTRRGLIEAKAIEAVLLLPPRLRTETGIQVALVVLRSPDAEAPPSDILLVDGSELGERGRHRTSLSEEAMLDLVDLVHTWRATGAIRDDAAGYAVALDPTHLDDASIDPARYRPRPATDLAALRSLIDDLRSQLELPSPPADENVPLNVLPLADVVEIIRGGPVKVTEDQAGRPVIGALEMTGRGQRHADPGNTALEVPVKEGDVVVVMDTRGGTLLVGPEVAGSILATECAVLRVTADEYLSPEWLHLWTTSKDFTDQVHAYSSGGAIARLSAQALKKFTVPLPTRELQAGVVDRIAEVDGEIASATHRLSLLEELRKAEAEVATARAENGR